MRLLNIMACLLAFTTLDARAAGEWARKGPSHVVKNRKARAEYFAAHADGRWAIAVEGPATIVVGLRLRAKVTSAEVHAELDEGGEIATPITTRRQRGVTLQGQKRARLTREVTLAYEVPSGSHTLGVRIDPPSVVGYLRMLDKVSKRTIRTAAFPAPAHGSEAVASTGFAAQSATEVASASHVAVSTSTNSTSSAPDPAIELSVATQPTHPPKDTRDTSDSLPVEVIAAKSLDSGETVAARASTPSSEGEVVAARASMSSSAPSADLVGIVAGVELGLGFPQTLSQLGTNLQVVLELGWALPIAERRIELFVDGSYTRATRAGTADDPRLTATDSFDYEVVEQQVAIQLGGLYRFFPPRTWLNFYAAGAARLELQRSDDRGDAATAAFGLNQETRTSAGGVVAGGVELAIGPGAVAGEVGFTFTKLIHRVTGDVSHGGPYLNVGYHVLF